MNKKKNATAKSRMTGGLISLVVVLAILVFANLIIGRLRLRVDLTEEKLYTLSEGTRNIVRELEEPVTLKLFFSSSSAEVPMFLKESANRLRDLLQEYEIAAQGNITVEHYDPKPDSDAEEWAERYGISGQAAGMYGPTIYFGLVATAGDTEGALPAIDPRQERLLEYNITRLIYRVGNPEKPVVGVMSSLPVLGSGAPNPMMMMQGQQQDPPWIAFRELRRDLDVREVAPSAEEIPADLDALMIVHPKDLGDKTLYAIDQFLLSGGRLIVFLDPMSFVDLQASQANPMMMQMSQGSSDLAKLLDTWGIGYEADKVLADKQAVSLVPGANGRPEQSPVVLSLNKDNVNADDVLTSQLETMMMAFAGVFTDRTDDDIKVTPLLTSSKSSCLVDGMTARMGGQTLRSEVKPTGTAYHIAVRLDGKFKTAFPDGEPGDAEGDAAESDEVAAAAGLKEGESSVLLIGDADMLYDPVCVEEIQFLNARLPQLRNDNLNFFANASELMAGSADLIGIRSRGTFGRPFTEVLKRQAKAQAEWQVVEQDVIRKLQEADRRLSQLQAEKDDSQRFILSPEQQAEIEKSREVKLQAEKELKEVRKNLRRDIERLGVWVKAWNVAAMPLLIAFAGMGYGIYRRVK